LGGFATGSIRTDWLVIPPNFLQMFYTFCLSFVGVEDRKNVHKHRRKIDKLTIHHLTLCLLECQQLFSLLMGHWET